MAESLYTYYPGKLSTLEIPDSDVNGYKRYRDSVTRNIFPSGRSSKETYTIRMPVSDQFAFGYAVDASWAQPINTPVVDPETDFGPDANCCEAWKIEVTDSGPGLTPAGGSTNLKISIYDWQGLDDAHPVIVECPDLFDGEVQAQLTSAGDYKSKYEVTIENTNLAGEGEHLLLVRKEAFENDPASQPWLDLTAYQVAKVLVKDEIGQPVEVTPPWLDMNPDAICVDGDFAYMASGIGGLFIVDISDPEGPVYVNQVDTFDEARCVAVKEGYAYVGTEDLLILDIDPVESASIVNTVSRVDHANYVSINGNYLYASGGNEFCILDITDPVSPSIIITFELSSGMMSSSSFGKVTASGDYAYVGRSHTSGDIGGGSGTSYSFHIYDINPPELAHGVGSLNCYGFCRDIVVEGGYAYITIGDLTIIDIDTPESPYIVGNASLPDRTTSLEVAGNYAFVTDSKSGLEIFDITQPESPALVNTVNTPGSAKDVALSGNFAFVADEGSGLQIIDIGDIGSSSIISAIEMIVDANGADVSGDYAYVGGQNFQIVNIEQPENAYIVKKVDTTSEIDIVKVQGGYAYIQGDEFQIIDIDPPESAYVVNTLDVKSRQFDIANGYAYSVRYDFKIIDIDPPESAYIVNTVDMPWFTHGVAVDGGYAYVTARDLNDSSDGVLKIIDIDPPESAYIVNSLITEDGLNYGIAVAEDYAYIASNTPHGNDIKVVNIENPESAFLSNTMGSCSNPFGIKELGGYIFTINGESGIQVIDINPPESPYYVFTIDSNDSANDVDVSGDYIYISDKDGGLRIFQLL